MASQAEGCTRSTQMRKPSTRHERLTKSARWCAFIRLGSRRHVSIRYLKKYLSRIRTYHKRAWEAYAQGLRDPALVFATRGIKSIASVPSARNTSSDSCSLRVVEAGLWYVLGCTCGENPRPLSRAIVICRAGKLMAKNLGAPTSWIAFNKLEADALLCKGCYMAAFKVFSEVSSDIWTAEPWSTLPVAPFRLRHDIALVQRLIRVGRIQASEGAKIVISLQNALAAMSNSVPNLKSTAAKDAQSELWWIRISDLDEHILRGLRASQFNLLHRLYPYPLAHMSKWEELDPLNDCCTWKQAELEFGRDGISVLDDLLSPEALNELWQYALEASCFRSTRPGYLGAFPSDGCVHPIIRRIAESLELRLHRVFAGHSLARWWLFKHLAAPGVGLHADDGAVNVNIWLTPDTARRSGGGMEVCRCVPERHTTFKEFNTMLPSAEAVAREEMLRSCGSDHVQYKQNRAVIFVSDRFHMSEPGDFVDMEKAPRVNLTLIFGERRNIQRWKTETVQTS